MSRCVVVACGEVIFLSIASDVFQCRGRCSVDQWHGIGGQILSSTSVHFSFGRKGLHTFLSFFFLLLVMIQFSVDALTRLCLLYTYLSVMVLHAFSYRKSCLFFILMIYFGIMVYRLILIKIRIGWLTNATSIYILSMYFKPELVITLPICLFLLL